MRERGFSLVKVSGGWVQPGQPRWRAYLFFTISIVGGLLLLVPVGAEGVDMPIFTIIGLFFVVFGIFGLIEAVRGKKLRIPGVDRG